MSLHDEKRALLAARRADALPVDPARTLQRGTCGLSISHSPLPFVIQRHHRFPKFLQATAYGIAESALEQDPRFDPTTIDLCGTHHDSVHAMIRELLAGRGHLLRVRVNSAQWHLVTYAVDRFEAIVRG